MAKRETHHDGEILTGDGPAIHYRLHGPAGGAPALFLHGWPQDGRMWLPIVDRLEESVRAIVPDLRSFGESEVPDTLDADDFVGDQLRLLDSLGIERAHVVGHDWGGWTGFLLAIEHPERVASLTVVNAPHPWPRLGASSLAQLPRSWYAAALATPLLGPALLRHTGLVTHILNRGSGGAIGAQEARRLRDSFSEPRRARAVSSLYRYYWRAFATAARGAWNRFDLTMPVQLLFGADDRMISADTVREGLSEHAPRGRLELINGPGHFLCDERPDLVAERVRTQVQLSS